MTKEVKSDSVSSPGSVDGADKKKMKDAPSAMTKVGHGRCQIPIPVVQFPDKEIFTQAIFFRRWMGVR